MSEKNSITFRELRNNKDDFQKIYTWCQNKYIYSWFEQRKLTRKEIEDKYKRKLTEGKQTIYIIMYNNIYEYDLFIGEKEYLNKGIGKQIIKQINQKIYQNNKNDAIILRPFKRNIRAIKCYEKSGFKTIYEYTDTDTLGNIEDIIVLLNERDDYENN